MGKRILVSIWALCILATVHALDVSSSSDANFVEHETMKNEDRDKTDHTISFLTLKQHTFAKLHSKQLSRKARKGRDGHARNIANQAKQKANTNEKNILKNKKKLKKQSQKLQEHAKDLKEHEKRLDKLHGRAFDVIKAIKMSHTEAMGIKNRIRSTAKSANKITEDIKSSRTQSEEVKSLATGQIAKLRRMWSTEDVRIKYAKQRRSRERADAKANKGYCKNEKHGHISIFSAVPLNEEIDSNSCINKNRDELIEAFCNFRQSFFDDYSKNVGLKNGQHYWPNICCKPFGKSKETDQCDDTTGTILREKIVPFALAKGGEVNFATLYGEVKDVIESNGYLDQGFRKLVDDISCAQQRRYINKITNGLAYFKKYNKWNKRSDIVANIRLSSQNLMKWKKQNNIIFPTYNKVEGRSFTHSSPILAFIENRQNFEKLLGTETFNNFIKWYLNRALRLTKDKMTSACLYVKHGIAMKDLDAMKNEIRDFFAQKSLLCGPRIFFEPPQEETTMCELFAPYKHMFATFRLGFERMFAQGKPSYDCNCYLDRYADLRKAFGIDCAQAWKHWKTHGMKEKRNPTCDDTTGEATGNSFLQLMETRQNVGIGDSVSSLSNIVKRKHKMLFVGKARDETTNTEEDDEMATDSTEIKVQEALARRSLIVKKEVKSADLKKTLHPKARVSYSGSKTTCPKVTASNQLTLDKYKALFCPNLKHLNLVNEEFENFAMLYIQDDINPRDKKLFRRLKERIKYAVDNDEGCATPLFSPKDISLQQIKGDWVALVKLDSKSKAGYLQSEVANCKTLDYLPQSIIKVNILQTVKKFCKHQVHCGGDDRRRRRRRRRRLFRSLTRCRVVTYPCGYKDIPLSHYHTKQPLEYTVTMTGATFQVDYHTKTGKRRRLLAKRSTGS
jgi:hypothetical protein